MKKKTPWSRTEILTLVGTFVTIAGLAMLFPSVRRSLGIEKPATIAQAPTKSPTPYEPEITAQQIEALPKQTTKPHGTGKSPSRKQAPPGALSPPMSQECAPGANCAISNGQQGGITAGQVIVNPQHLAKVTMIPEYENRPGTFSQPNSAPVQGFESKYRIVIDADVAIPELKVRVINPAVLHIDCDKMNGQGMSEGTGMRGSGAVFCSIPGAYGESGSVTVFATEATQLNVEHRCVGTKCEP